MKLLKNGFYVLFKIYYFTVFFLIYLVLYPFFVLNFAVFKNNKFTYLLHRIWAFLLNTTTLIFVKKRTSSLKLPDEPLVIISNHTSFLDIFLMYQLLPNHPSVFMAKAELTKIPLFKTLFRYYHIPVYRKDKKKAAQALMKCQRSLRKGLSIVIFPEGGIVDGLAPKLGHFKNGAFDLAKRENVAILPITFTRNFKILAEPNSLFSVSRPGIAEAVIHEVITKEEIQNMDILTLKDRCFEIIEKPLREMYDY